MSYYKKLRYKIDKSLSRSIWSVISLLFLLVFVIVLFISLIDHFFISDDKASFHNTFLDYVISAIKGMGFKVPACPPAPAETRISPSTPASAAFSACRFLMTS